MYYTLCKDGDFSENIQSAMDRGVKMIFIPDGEYTLNTALKIPSGVHIKASYNAHVRTRPGFVGLSVISNADTVNGNEKITIEGGIWDGNCGEQYRASYKDSENVSILFLFDRVRNLRLKNMRMMDSLCYYVRLFKCVDFEVSDIDIVGELHPMCQDGIHMNGGCENGLVKNITAKVSGDDLIALNADDDLTFGQQMGVENLPIRNITVKNVSSDNCHTGIRLLSVDQPIENIKLENFRIGYKEFGINLDATRYCANFIYDPADYPEGVGKIKNVTAKNFSMWNVGKRPKKPVVIFNTNAENFRLESFKRLKENEPKEVESETLRFAYIGRTSIRGDVNKDLENQEEFKIYDNEFSELKIN